jgi:hypothetical protein
MIAFQEESRGGAKVLVEAAAIEADHDPGIWEEIVRAFEESDIFVS